MGSKIFLFSTLSICELNEYFATRIYDFLKKNGYELAGNPSEADTIIIVNCGVGQKGNELDFGIVGRYVKNYLGKKRIILAGCLPKINDSFNSMEGVETIIPTEIEKFDELFEHETSIRDIKSGKLNRGFSFKCDFSDDFIIEICSGCVNNCAYCGVKKIKGNVKSKPINGVINELKRGIEAGHERFALIGDDCTSYGIDIGTDFAELLNKMHECTDREFKLNIHRSEPRMLMKLFPKINKDVFRKRIYFLSVSIQSTSQRLIKMMDRNYDVEEFLKLMKKIKSLNPEIKTETHVIYSFPTETREEFLDSFRLRNYFGHVSYYCYFDWGNTKAVGFDGKISKEEKEYRTNLLMAEREKNGGISFQF